MSGKKKNSESTEKKTHPHGEHNVFTSIAEHMFAATAVYGLSVLAATIGGSAFKTQEEMILWLCSVFGAAVIAHAIFIALQYLFPHRLVIQRFWPLHLAFFSVLVLVVISTSAGTLLYSGDATARLERQLKAAEESARELQTRQENANRHTLRLYRLVGDSIHKILASGKVEPTDLPDILSHCVQSFRVNSDSTRSIRATVTYIDRTGKYLIMPQHGFCGTGFDSDIQRLYFDISPRTDLESKPDYLGRLGVAGWSFVYDTDVLDADVQSANPSRSYRYKVFPASEKDQTDRAMMCVPIHRAGAANEKTMVVGVLSVSSTEPGAFTDDEAAVVRFFAAILASFEAPLETPGWLQHSNNNTGQQEAQSDRR